jgi:hypothetical protein
MALSATAQARDLCAQESSLAILPAHAMLPAETFETRRLSTLSSAKPRWIAEEILKTFLKM